MPKKYHIKTQLVPPRFTPISKFQIERSTECINCGKCKNVCVYEVHKKLLADVRKMTDSIDYLCKNCFRCIQECSRNALTKKINPIFKTLGNSYWKGEIITSTWLQAETGKVPVFGAGYRGKFVGKGFDEMWTDMSEIVRPTRDGIHGREYISTSVDLGKNLFCLNFDKEGNLLSEIPPIIDIPIPIVFNILPFANTTKNISILSNVATNLETFSIVEIEKYTSELVLYKNNIILHFDGQDVKNYFEQIENVRIVELEYHEEVLDQIKIIKEKFPQIIIAVKIHINKESYLKIKELVENGVEIIHLSGTNFGVEFEEQNSRFAKDVIREIHLHLVKHSLRDSVTLIYSGGIALAEYMAKAIICGVDLVSIDIPLLVALECRLCEKCDTFSCPVEIENVSVEFGKQRIMNMIGSWHSQLLEVLGAMGIREVRRLRGEVGRAIFYEDMEKEIFEELKGDNCAY
ncbi:MAG: glutamate synthase-related protein [bacterium]